MAGQSLHFLEPVNVQPEALRSEAVAGNFIRKPPPRMAILFAGQHARSEWESPPGEGKFLPVSLDAGEASRILDYCFNCCKACGCGICGALWIAVCACA